MAPLSASSSPSRRHQPSKVWDRCTNALRAELALVEGELVPRLEADDLLAFHLEHDPALLPTEAAVGLDLAVGVDAAVPASRWRPVEVRAVTGDELLLADRRSRHQPNPPTAIDC